MADNQEIVAPPAGGEDQPVEVPKRNQKPEIPPVTFREFNVSFSFFLYPKNVAQSFPSNCFSMLEILKTLSKL